MIKLEEKQKWDLSEKVLHALTVIDSFYHNKNGKVYIGFSGGKDSTVLVWLADKFCKAAGYNKIPLIFNNTTNEHKEILDFVKNYGDRVTWLKPKMTFAQSLIKYGYPLISKDQSQKISEAKNTKSDKLRNIRLNGIKKIAPSGREYTIGKISEKWKFLVDSDIELTSKCCDILKKNPVKIFEKESKLHPIIGTMASESGMRKQAYLRNNNKCNTFEGKRPISKPLSIFTEKDIWGLIKKYNIKISDIYIDQIIQGKKVQGEKRTGCAYCAFGIQFEDPLNTKFHRLFIREPKRYKSMMDKLGYRKALHEIGIKLPDDE